MKKTYIKPELESDAIVFESSIMGISGLDENGKPIITGGDNGDGGEGDVNKASLWDDEDAAQSFSSLP